MKPISVELRERVIESYREGMSFGQIAAHYRLAKSTVQHLVEHYRATGSVVPKPFKGGREPAFAGESLSRLEQDVLAHPDATLEELRGRSGKKVSLTTIHNTLRKVLGFTRKKSLYVRASSDGPTCNANVRPGANR